MAKKSPPEKKAKTPPAKSKKPKKAKPLGKPSTKPAAVKAQDSVMEKLEKFFNHELKKDLRKARFRKFDITIRFTENGYSITEN